MQDVLVGTAGHIDHGKTTLVKALTGIDTDRLLEEKRRGITIDIGFAFMKLEGFRVGFIDVPGHERFVKNMLAGVGSIRFVLLVVAADESVMPQTIEHFRICQLLEIPRGMIVLTKKSQADPDLIALVQEEVRDLVRGTFLEGASLVVVDSLSGQGIPELEQTLLKDLQGLPVMDTERRLFRMPIDRVFSSRGFGTVVTGTPFAGRVGKNDFLEAYPANLFGKVRSIQVFGETVDSTGAGQRTALNLSGVERVELERGMVLAPPNAFQATQILDVSLQILSAAPAAVSHRDPIRFHHGSAEVMGRIYLFGDKDMSPGSRGLAQLRLERPTLVCALDHFVLRRYSPMTTIAGGIVLDSHAPKRKKKSWPQVLPLLRQLEQAWQEKQSSLECRLVDYFINQAGPSGIGLRDLAARLGLRLEVVSELVEASEEHEVLSPGHVVSQQHVRELQSRVLAFLQAFHKSHLLQLGVPQEELKNRCLPRVAGIISQQVLNRLIAAGQIQMSEGLVKESDWAVTLSCEQEAIRQKLLARFEPDTLMPPSLPALLETVGYPQNATREIYYYLVQGGELIRISSEIVISKIQKEWMVKHIRASFAAGDSFGVAQFKALFGITRKFAIPYLEFLDRQRITRRVADQRVVL